MSNNNNNILRYDDGAIQFRLRLIGSILSHRPIIIRNIHNTDMDIDHIGLRTYEISYLRLLDQITNGTQIEINTTGTQLRFIPGILIGGTIQYHFNCPVKKDNDNDNSSNVIDDDYSNNIINQIQYRSIGWFLEGLIPLAPFGKESLSIQLTGITDGVCHIDPSCDLLNYSLIPILMNQFHIGNNNKKDGINDNNDLLMESSAPFIKIIRRGGYPHGGGLVHFYCPMIRNELSCINYVDVGKIKRIRGYAISTKIISNSITARIAYATKGIFHKVLPDVWIHTDVHTISKQQCGIDPTISLILVAESTTGVIIASESTKTPHTKELPEDMGIRSAYTLLNDIENGCGCINNNSSIQSIILLLMCLSSEDVSRIRIGKLNSYTIEALRLYKQIFGVEFKLKPDWDTKTIICSCLGIGYRNMARAST